MQTEIMDAMNNRCYCVPESCFVDCAIQAIIREKSERLFVCRAECSAEHVIFAESKFVSLDRNENV